MRKFCHGFTLIELLITLAIAVLLIGIGVPSYQQYVANNRTILLTNQFISTLLFARSEAIERNTRVSTCAVTANNSDNCRAANVGENAANWSNGWIVFIDTNVLGVRDAGDEILFRFYDVPANSNFTGFNTQITYENTGFPGNNFDGTYQVVLSECYAGTTGRQIQISPTGRPSVVTIPCP